MVNEKKKYDSIKRNELYTILLLYMRDVYTEPKKVELIKIIQTK